MFAAMEALLTWPEKLGLLKKGDSIIVDTHIQTVYSAIHNHFPEGQPKRFTVRLAKSGPQKGQRFVFRLK